MRRPQVDKKGRAVSWSFTEVSLNSTHQDSRRRFATLTRIHTVCLTSPGKHNPGIQLE